MGTLTPVPSVAVRYFLKNKVSPDLCNEDGLTALHQVRLGSLRPRLPAPGSPPGQVPHLPASPPPHPHPHPEPWGGEPQLPHLKGSCPLGDERVCYRHTHRTLCPRARGTHTASKDREPLSPASLLPGKGIDKQSKFVWSLTVYEARLFTPTKASIHPRDKSD